MAKILNGILGGGRGKVSQVVMGIWKGIAYLKAYSIPANPQTPAQTTVRGKFGQLSKIMSQFNVAFIAQYFGAVLPRMSGYNAFFRKNYDAYETGGALEEWLPNFKVPRVDAGAGNAIVISTVTDDDVTINGASSEILTGDRVLVVTVNKNADYLGTQIHGVQSAVASANNQNLLISFVPALNGSQSVLLFKLRGGLYSEVTIRMTV